MNSIDYDKTWLTEITKTVNTLPSDLGKSWRILCTPNYFDTYGVYSDEKYMTVKRVIINKPATIILWEDGSKTVVKCASDEPFDAEKGIAMAYIKHVMFKDKTTKCNKWFDKQLEQLNEE